MLVVPGCQQVGAAIVMLVGDGVQAVAPYIDVVVAVVDENGVRRVADAAFRYRTAGAGRRLGEIAVVVVLPAVVGAVRAAGCGAGRQMTEGRVWLFHGCYPSLISEAC